MRINRFGRIVAGIAILVAPHAGAAPPVTKVACPLPADGAFCGQVSVPLSAASPDRGTLLAGFRLYTPPSPATGTIVARQGGPGLATTAPMFVSRVRALMAPLFAAGRAELFVDQRGRGLSGALDCPALQSGETSIIAVQACSKALTDVSGVPGSAAGAYSSAAAADDLDIVRAALVASGQIADAPLDLFGQSYAGFDIEAYASRYASHLRSIVGDSPATSRTGDFGLSYAPKLAGAIAEACGRNFPCGPDLRAAGRLVEELRTHPADGSGPDYTGAPVAVTASEHDLLLAVADSVPAPGTAQDGQEFLNHGELPAASRAWLAGDRAPLFRLLAENASALLPAPGGNPGKYSDGELYATACADLPAGPPGLPWDWAAPLQVRMDTYAAALRALPPEQIAPWSADAWNAFLEVGLQGDACIAWPTPPTPVIAPGQPRIRVPTLALTGSLDTNVPSQDVRMWACGARHARVVELQGRGHTSAVRGDACAQSLVRAFIADPAAPLDAGCAATPAILPLATADFPPVAARAQEAGRDGADASRPIDRRQATAAVQTALDAFKRFIMSGGAGDGPAFADVGLRGGTMTGDFASDVDGSLTVTLTAARFAADLPVSGQARWDPVTFALSGTLTLAGADGTPAGTVTLDGTWREPGGAPLAVRGTLNGRPVALRVPPV